MAKNITQYSTFLSSPGDLVEERNEIETLINELNLTYGYNNSISIDLIKWETHSASGITNTYTQDIINNDIGNDYDIFIGLMWLKFGTPTQISNSGTEEEFLKAVERFNKGENIQIMFYFKNKTPLSLDEINPEELIKIKNFKQLLKDNNVLFWKYETIEELKTLLRMHLPKRLDELKNKQPHTLVKTDNENSLNIKENHDELEDIGVLDFMFTFSDYFDSSNSALNNITSNTDVIGIELQKKAEEITNFVKTPNPNKNLIISHFKRVSKTIDKYSEQLKLDTPAFYENFEGAINIGLEFINSCDNNTIDEHRENLNETLENIRFLKNNIPNAIKGMQSFYEEATKLPNMQTDLNKSKRKLVAQLEHLIHKLKKSYELTSEFEKQLEYKLLIK